MLLGHHLGEVLGGKGLVGLLVPAVHLALFFAVVAVHIAALVLVHLMHALALLVVALGGRHRLGWLGLLVGGRWLVLGLRGFFAGLEVGLHRRLFGLG